jgi:pimeloyl-ACP methyl ester carboxylesterase
VAPIARELSESIGVLEPLQTRLSVDGQVEELAEVLSSRASAPVTLIGHSWGAWLALITAARRPDLVRKLILVDSGPFEAKYVPEIQSSRLNRLSSAERSEFEQLMQVMGSAAPAEQDRLMARLGGLVEKADNYDLFATEDHPEDALPVDGKMYEAVWPEAAELRRSGALLKYAEDILCPVIAVHGEQDPHPAAGVREPLQKAVRNFRFVLLSNCGHSPWLERQARGAFFEVLRREIWS